MTPATRHELWDLTRDLRTGKVLKMDRVPPTSTYPPKIGTAFVPPTEQA